MNSNSGHFYVFEPSAWAAEAPRSAHFPPYTQYRAKVAGKGPGISLGKLAGPWKTRGFGCFFLTRVLGVLSRLLAELIPPEGTRAHSQGRGRPGSLDPLDHANRRKFPQARDVSPWTTRTASFSPTPEGAQANTNNQGRKPGTPKRGRPSVAENNTRNSSFLKPRESCPTESETARDYSAPLGRKPRAPQGLGNASFSARSLTCPRTCVSTRQRAISSAMFTASLSNSRNFVPEGRPLCETSRPISRPTKPKRVGNSLGNLSSDANRVASPDYGCLADGPLTTRMAIPIVARSFILACTKDFCRGFKRVWPFPAAGRDGHGLVPTHVGILECGGPGCGVRLLGRR